VVHAGANTSGRQARGFALERLRQVLGKYRWEDWRDIPIRFLEIKATADFLVGNAVGEDRIVLGNLLESHQP
jgi:hypothetical protein